MSDVKLTTSAVCDVSGLHRSVLEKWVRAGIVSPSNGAEGSGHYRTWSPVQATALAYAVTAGLLTPTGRSARLSAKTEGYAALLARFVAGHSAEELEAAFTEGRTLVVMIGGNETFQLITPPPGVRLPSHLDLAQTYRLVLQRIGTLATATEEATS